MAKLLNQGGTPSRHLAERRATLFGIPCEKCGSQFLEFWNTENTVMVLICPRCEPVQLDDIPERKISWDDYRQRTGICETCRHPMEGHLVCEGCGILTGVGHMFSLSSYRGKELCPYCIKQWKDLEADRREKLTWEEWQKVWR